MESSLTPRAKRRRPSRLVYSRRCVDELKRCSKCRTELVPPRPALLGHVGIALPEEIPDFEGAVADDVVDAAVIAWSAHRHAGGTARSIPYPRPTPAAASPSGADVMTDKGRH